MNDILVALDLDSDSARLIAEAVDLVKVQGGRIWLLHVAPPDPHFVGMAVGPDSVRDSLAGKRRTEHLEVQELADGLRSQGYECNALLVQGDTADSILSHGTRLAVRYIILGGRQRSWAARVLLGSVATDVIRCATRPVLIVPV